MNELRIDPRFTTAAMNKDGSWYAYDRKPTMQLDNGKWGGYVTYVSLAAFNLNQHIDWRDSLHEIVHEDGRSFLRKHVDVPGDGEPVIVWDDQIDQYRYYSAGKLIDGQIRCYANGCTKWTSDGDMVRWRYWRRPTAEELEV